MTKQDIIVCKHLAKKLDHIKKEIMVMYEIRDSVQEQLQTRLDDMTDKDALSFGEQTGYLE